MEADWNERTLRVQGNWTGKWLYLAPVYELWLDDECIDSTGGPLLRPTLEAMVETDGGELHHVRAELLSVAGIKPHCELTVDDEMVAADHVPVKNVLNPLLMLAILGSTAVMLYVGPDVVSAYVPW